MKLWIVSGVVLGAAAVCWALLRSSGQPSSKVFAHGILPFLVEQSEPMFSKRYGTLAQARTIAVQLSRRGPTYLADILDQPSGFNERYRNGVLEYAHQ